MATDTRPFCGSCGWDFRNGGQGDKSTDLLCDSCGADLRRFGFTGLGPPDNPPSVPHAAPLVDSVEFTWTESPESFPDGYDFRYTIDGADETVVNSATSPQVVAAVAGEEVCGSLRGYRSGYPSDWSADACETALAAP